MQEAFREKLLSRCYWFTKGMGGGISMQTMQWGEKESRDEKGKDLN